MGKPVEFELSLYSAADGQYEARARVETGDSRKQHGPWPVALDPVRLRALEADARGYGAALTEMLFRAGELAARLGEALSNAFLERDRRDQFVRLRLMIDPSAEELQAVQWERLCLPGTDQPLCTREDFVFSRYLPPPARVELPQRKEKLRALAAVAAPSDAAQQGYAVIDRAREVERARAGLAGFQVQVLEPPCTLERLAQAAQGVDVLYLVCHGTQRGGRYRMLLEDEHGRAKGVFGDELAVRLAGSGALPRLVVLAVCDSGQSAGVGPALVAAGVPAVIAMQAALSFDTAERFFPALFRELDAHGAIDRAAAIARRGAADRADWWAPVVFMNLASGQLWETQPAVQMPTVPRLAPAVADFVGREEDLEKLCAALEGDRAVAISGVHGMGGIGKTQLALKLVEKIGHRYPDGHLLLDMNGTDGALALTPSRAMEQVIHAFVPEARLPEEITALAGLYRGLLEGRRVLLLLDNARDAAQVEPLLPPPGCLVLVTSRARIALPGMTDIHLETLSEGEAVALLREIELRIGAHASALAKACGCLPLALRVVASTLHKQPNLSAEEVLRRMEDDRKRLKLSGVEASLGLSYAMLSGELQEQWRKLGVFTGDFGLWAVPWVWGTVTNDTTREQKEEAREAAQDALGELIQYSLVEFREGRCRLHDLARVYAVQRMGAEEESAARLAHANYYQSLMRWANQEYDKGGERVLSGLKAFDVERREIEAAQRWTAQACEEEWNRLTLDSLFYEAGFHVLPLRLLPRECIRWLESGLRAARMLGNRLIEENYTGNLGNAYGSLGDVHKATEYYEQALSIAQEIGDRRGEGNALGRLGQIYADLGNIHKAIDYHIKDQAIRQEINDRRGEGIVLRNLGNAYAYLGGMNKSENAIEHYVQSISYYVQSLEINREIGDRGGEGATLGHMGNTYAKLSEIRKKDVESCVQQLMNARAVGDGQEESDALDNLEKAYANLYEVQEKAITYYEEALFIAKEIGDRQGEGAALGSLGLAYSLWGEVQKAENYFEQAIIIHRSNEDRRNEVVISWNLGLIYEKDDPARAAELMQPLVDYYREIGHPDAEKLAAYAAEVRGRVGK